MRSASPGQCLRVSPIACARGPPCATLRRSHGLCRSRSIVAPFRCSSLLLSVPRLPTLAVARYGTTAHSASQYSLSLILLLGYHLLSGLNVLFLMPLSSMLILKSPARTIPTDLILCFCLASILVQTMSNYFRFSESRRKKFLRSEIWVVFEFYGVPQHQADLALYVRSKNTCSFIIRTVDTHV